MTASDKSTAEWLEIKATFKNDEVRDYIKKDATLCAWGNSLTMKCGKSQAKYIRDKLRTIGTFCKSYNEKYGTDDITDDISVRDIFQTKNFESIFDIAKLTFGTSLTPPVKLGGYIKEIMVILKQQAIYSNDTEKKEEIDNFLYLVNTQWNLISAPHIRMLKDQKPVVVEMPITSDIRTFLESLSGKIKQYVDELSQFKTLEIWMKLSKYVQAFLIVFNRRREGEVSRVKLETYTQMPNYDEMETDVFTQTLSTIEQYLCKHYSYMTTKGKRNRRVPILYPQNIKVALDSLVENRQTCGIKTNNQFLFPNTVLGFNRGCDVLRELVTECCLTCEIKKPSLITSTKLRKHVATVAQIMILNTGELGHLSNHMGHSEAVHREFYRQQESTIEKTHIAKLLQLVNTGKIAKYKGKTLDDISLEDVITAFTDDVNNEAIDDDDDDDVDDLDDDSDEEVNVSIDNEVVSEPSSSTSKQSLHEKPKVTLNPTSRVKPKLSRYVWPTHIKDAIKVELGDCIHKIKNLTKERGTAFIEKYSLQELGYSKLRNVVYNMGRTKR